LKLQGVDDDKETATTRDTAFLMRQMELREALAGVRDAEDPGAELDRLMRDIRQMIEAQAGQLAVQLESGTPEQLQAARESVSRMQFLDKLYNEAESVEAELEETR
jgi:molecular chaperone HscB